MTLDIHYPVVKVRTPFPRHGLVENILTMITVDDAVWPVIEYQITGQKEDGFQKITLTFMGDVTVEHPK